ncbi:2-amino-4-hydroxy-6-hydroxymethyldihydropteridine diphosphokinase [Pseudidiomarina homiensis]|uniref:2-amino-4-hydroxy-6-hydroxymethyldihydropteridine pyrophosphokinase n=1 Tax=Pseudidiomarina homiensis TaxID=364198 RepID=A0A432Y3D7_9GAMM|nr:2-amino-4-hydroxy-6-hydroxymethyldihydropteridine diphosphokinase [Pseudidiomarina homiensis]RUO55416.1 2-amino-4-hydroxy-6-hydroxymethyldihydropteridine diphosphokinase [Pseudidiomarina homiensis]
MTQRYLCSMGANIAPEKNFSLAKEQLKDLGRTYFSAARYTQPVAIETEHEFLNALFIIESSLPAQQLKAKFNAIEEALGRDRSDPRSSEKDRPMDIDILAEITAELTSATLDKAWLQVPSYLANLAEELKVTLHNEELIA